MREEERQEVRKGKRGMGGKRRAEERKGSAEGKGREGGEEGRTWSLPETWAKTWTGTFFFFSVPCRGRIGN